MVDIILEFDDLHPNPQVDCLSLVETLVSKYPNLVLNFFVPPNYKDNALFFHVDWCKRLRTLVDAHKVCLGIHGYNHSQEEFKHKNYPEAVSSIKASESILRSVGLEQSMVFRGPHWGLCEASIEALIDLGYTHLYSHTSYDNLTNKYKDDIKIIHYNWNLKDDFPIFENPMTTDICVAHGHTHNVCKNGINEVYYKIEQLIEKENPTFLSLDEYV